MVSRSGFIFGAIRYKNTITRDCRNIIVCGKAGLWGGAEEWERVKSSRYSSERAAKEGRKDTGGVKGLTEKKDPG